MSVHRFALAPQEQEQLRPWVEGGHPAPVTPRGAATVLLLREGSGEDGRRTPGAPGLEVFLLRRRSTMAFAPRMHVFPGGGVDPRDADRDIPWVGPSAVEWGHLLGAPAELARALVCAAVRELFEECGVLLAGPAAGPAVLGEVGGADWEADRLALLDRSLAMSELLVRRGLALRSDLLRAWAHWQTPEFEPRRFDTWFFLAALPAGQRARDIGEEADRAAWVPVEELLAGEAAGRLAMLPPTRATVADVVAAVRHRAPGQSALAAALDQPRRLRRVMPWLARSGDEITMVVDLDGRGGGRPGPAGGGGR